MDRLRDVLNGAWAGTYSPSGVKTQMNIVANTLPNSGNLEISGSGRDAYGSFTLKGSATSPTDVSWVKNLGWLNEWWHRATVDVDRKQMQGSWGPKMYPDAVHGSYVFERQVTEAERQREAEAATQRQAEEARKREEAAAAAARQRQQEEGEAVRKKKEEENEAEAQKQREEAEAARKRAEEAEAARKKQAELQDSARKEREDAERRRKEAEDAARKKEEAGTKQQQELVPGPQTTDGNEKLVGSTKDSEDGVAGNLKVHLKLDLNADIRVIAALRGDIAIGIL